MEDPESIDTSRAPVEQAVAQIWQEVFGHPVTRDDDFFLLGGHSLIAAQLVATTQARLGASGLQAYHVLEAPTVAEFAALVASFLPTSSRASD